VKRPTHRLPADTKHGFGGGAIDRSQPLSFRLNGRQYEAFAGDTVLSALLTAGVDTAGTYFGEPIGIDERFAPPVIARGERDATRAMPMDRVPVIGGLDLVTVGPRRGAITDRVVAGRSLGHLLDDPHALEGGWLRAAPQQTIEADLIVVGGGICGMRAALSATEAGAGRVLLVERRMWLGGDARFFGAIADQEPPETTVTRLIDQIAATPAITVLLNADAFALSGTRLRVHQIVVENDMLQPRVVSLEAPRLVLATGSDERLPIFPGNRAPGIVGAIAAFHRAERHGLWPGKRTVFATPHNFAYRLALLVTDAGIEVQRVADSRPAPQSRYIDFCKASGITLATGLVPRTAEPGRDAEALRVAFAVSIEGIKSSDTAAITTTQFIAAGTFQPRLALWLMAGGRCAYEAATPRLGARGAGPAGVVLAGAAAGFRSSPACLRSGEAAIARLYGKEPPAVEDIEIDAIYETPEGATPIAPLRSARGAAFLDSGFSFATRPAFRTRASGAPTQLRALSLGDVAAAVDVGLIPATEAGVVAAERCLGGGEIIDSGWLPSRRPRGAAPPAYLTGRFGTNPQRVVIAANEARRFESGSLIYPNTDVSGPFAAVGAIFGTSSDGALAVVAREALEGVLFVRDVGGTIPVRVVERLRS
jgi:sarcosine oxidase subunit alpha